MSFQSIPDEKVSCEDFIKSIFSNCCKLSHKCKKEGYRLAPNSDLCTGIEISPKPKYPTPEPPEKKRS